MGYPWLGSRLVFSGWLDLRWSPSTMASAWIYGTWLPTTGRISPRWEAQIKLQRLHGALIDHASFLVTSRSSLEFPCSSLNSPSCSYFSDSLFRLKRRRRRYTILAGLSSGSTFYTASHWFSSSFCNVSTRRKSRERRASTRTPSSSPLP